MSNAPAKTIKIGSKVIGEGDFVYIIAEMACAHDGDINKAKKIIDGAVAAGADAVQLQFFKVSELMAPSHDAFDIVTSIEFNDAQWTELVVYCRSKEIDVFACTYDVPSAELAVKLKADGIKLNSSDLSNPELLEYVAESSIPFTIGTGASTVDEIRKAVETSLENGGGKFVIMHGVQNFPTDIEKANINKIKLFKEEFGAIVGYQDHTSGGDPLSKVIDLLAIGAGASIVEKHITFDRSEEGIDYQASLNPDDFKDYVKTIRDFSKAMGEPVDAPLTEEDKKYRKFQKKSVCASVDINEGEIIEREHLSFLRCGSDDEGISPMKVDTVVGKKASADIKKFDAIKLEDIF